MNMKRILSKIIMIALVLSQFISVTQIDVYANEEHTPIGGVIYEMDKKNEYNYLESTIIKDTNNALGSLEINGAIKNEYNNENFPCYSVSSNDVSFSYSIDNLNTVESKWHLVKDSGKKINGLKLDDKIGYGAIVVQTSKDGKKWITEYTESNVFEQSNVSKDNFYKTNNIQLVNGTYYRVVVAYEMRIKIDESKILFIKKNDYEYKKVVEVYDFYLFDKETKQYESANDNKYNLGYVINTGKDNGYSGNEQIDEDDPHYGWDIGKFFIKGYTSCKTEVKDNPIFLKNVGDKVTLYFNLEQDIDCLNGDEKKTIHNDANGYDQYFQTDKTGFGRGTLIIRYTDSENVKHTANIYTNYLEANISPRADTVVQLFEEGDYEVALNYEIKDGKLLSEYTNYRIFFKFSVRNGNSMVYSFDSVTGAELLNGSTTKNGFRLDLAKSKYLDVIVKKEVLTENEDGIIEDTRYNRPAKDGELYTDSGIYTIKVTNRYTNESTVKKICVGDSLLMRAYMRTGMSIDEIADKLSDGATINEDGSIVELEYNDEGLYIENELEENLDESNSLIFGLLTIVVIGIVALYLKSQKNRGMK